METEKVIVNCNTYYKKMQIEYGKLRDNLANDLNQLTPRINELHTSITEDLQAYSNAINAPLSKYNELIENRYTTGSFYRFIKNVIIANSDRYTDCIELRDLVEYASKQKEAHEIQLKLDHYNKCLSLSSKEYTHIVKTFYTEVGRQMVLNGYGYAFEGSLGFICINRCVKRTGRPKVDMQKTKERKKELIAQGIQIWDKGQYEFAKAHGLEYNAVKPAVYQDVEAFYEVPLMGCTIPNGFKHCFTVPNTVNYKIKNKTYKELIELCDRDVEKICKLPIDFRKKAYLCMEVDKTLYKKYIRNENQCSLALTKISRKNR